MINPIFVSVEANDAARLHLVSQLANTIWNVTYSSTLKQEQIVYMLDMFQSPKAISNQLTTQNYEYYLVYNETEAVGYLGIQLQNDSIFLSKIYLLPQWQGTGLAKHIFLYVNELADKHGKNKIWLTVNKHNAKAIHAYRKMGFLVIRKQVVDIGQGYVMDDYVMGKEL